LSGARINKDKSEWLITDRPDLLIIEPELFTKAQQIIEERVQAFKADKERQSNKHLFSTLIKCKECGWSFRRLERTYKNTYIRWVCSGRNGKGADSCHNNMIVDEAELITVLDAYFAGLLREKKNIIKTIIREFARIYKSKEDNKDSVKELHDNLKKLHKRRQKFLDMYTDELISREELNSKLGGSLGEIAKVENELQLIEHNIIKGEQLASIIRDTFGAIEDIVSVREMNNAQLKRIIKKIEVDKCGNVDIYLCLLSDLGLTETVLFCNDCT